MNLIKRQLAKTGRMWSNGQHPISLSPETISAITECSCGFVRFVFGKMDEEHTNQIIYFLDSFNRIGFSNHNILLLIDFLKENNIPFEIKWHIIIDTPSQLWMQYKAIKLLKDLAKN